MYFPRKSIGPPSGIKHETVDRLLLSRSLIAPLRFKPANDRFAVASHVLAAHDAAELAIGAVCTEKSVPNVSDSRAMGLPDYLGELKKHLHPNRDVSGKDYVRNLNRVRVNLKHYGVTPDKDQWGTVAEVVFGLISSWCKEYLNVDYAALDAVDLISVASIRDIVRSARDYLNQNKFKECLEKLAEAISSSGLELFPNGLHIVTGQADAETALTVSAYGIDPGRFIALQRLLPSYDWLLLREPHWTKRQYGHEGNWNRPNAEFAYEETVNLLTRLQSATPYPTPSLYENVFRDVLVVKVDSPEVTVMEWSPDNGWVEPELMRPPKFTAGDRIKCHARGAFVVPVDPEQCNDKPEHSPLVVALDAEHPSLGASSMPPTLIFKHEDIEIEKELLYDEETGS